MKSKNMITLIYSSKKQKIISKIFRLKFFITKKKSHDMRGFAYEINVYFQKSIGDLQVNKFLELLELIIFNQIRHN